MLIGIVGKPSCGKSTFFKSLTLAEVEIASYPFTTIKPNHAIGFVRVECVDKEFNVKCNPREGYCLDGTRFVPVNLLDVAGLVPGAHEGKGLGNKFLDDLRQADVLIHVIDISGSTNEKGESVEKLSYNPENDIKFLETELDLWFFQLIKKGWDKFIRQLKMEHSELHQGIAKQLSSLGVTEEIAEEVIKTFQKIPETDDEILLLATMIRKKTKPMIIAANKIDVSGSEKNYNNLKNKFKDYIIIPCSAESELSLREAVKKNLIKYIPGNNKFEIIGDLNEKQKKALTFIKENILNKYKTTGVQDVLDKSVFDLLKYIAIFPGGVSKLEDSQGRVIPDCFLLKEGSTALDFAFKIHTDIGNKFVKAIDVKKRLPVGKDHKLRHRDVIEIKTT